MTYILNTEGKPFSYLDPASTPDAVTIEDIAESLAKEVRFTGKTVGVFYSVAQHCVLASHLVPRPFALEALLHDAAEAYCKDLSKPLKVLLPAYTIIEKRVDHFIRHQYNLPFVLSPVVKAVDNRLLVTERRDLLPLGKGHELAVWPNEVPYDEHIRPWEWNVARCLYLARFHELKDTMKYARDARL